METITSRQNPLCVQVRKLAAEGKYRRRTGRFLCDSPKLVQEALRWTPEAVETVLCTSQALLPALPGHVRAVLVPEEVMASLAPSKTPQGVLAVCILEDHPLPQTLEGRRYVVLDSVQDPGNVGTVLRTADAFWCDGVFLVGGCADLWSPKTLRASMGAAFRCPVWSCTAQELSDLLRRSGIPLWGAALREDTADVKAVDWSRAALAIGSEGQGLSRELLEMCDGTVRIPMQEHCESLNAAAAAAVLIWEMARAAGKV
ncbi:MAG: RNA methyltransferase [Oscillospiraceae bacterium]|nr:RNA methyltransferase [Oscillospiraceae bacterium]